MKKKHRFSSRSILDNWSVSQDELPRGLTDQRISIARLEHMLTVAETFKLSWAGDTLHGMIDDLVDRIRTIEELFCRTGAKGGLWLVCDDLTLYLIGARWNFPKWNTHLEDWVGKIIADNRDTNPEELNAVTKYGTLLSKWQIFTSGLMPRYGRRRYSKSIIRLPHSHLFI